MKLYETFISERISLVKYKDLIFDAIQQGVTDSVRQMYYKVAKYPESKRDAIRDGDLSEVKEYANRELTRQLEVLVPVSISYAIRDELKIPVVATARDIGKTEAHASGRSIVYNKHYFSRLSSYILEDIEEYTMGTYGSLDELDKDFQDAFKKIEISGLLTEYNIQSLVSDLVSVTLHELTHVIQHDRQIKADRPGLEYRSYLEPNKEKFHQVVARLGDQNPEDYRLYQASPQEITAFAQQAADRIVRINNLAVDAEARKMIRKSPSEYIEDYTYKKFNNPSNAREYAVFKRFNKLVYQFVMDYVDELDKKQASVDKRDK